MLKYVIMRFSGILLFMQVIYLFFNILLIRGDNTCKIPVLAFYRLCYLSVCYEGF